MRDTEEYHSLASLATSNMHPREVVAMAEELDLLLQQVKTGLLPDGDCRKQIKEKVVDRIKLFKAKLDDGAGNLHPLQEMTYICGLMLMCCFRLEFQHIFNMDYEFEPGCRFF